MWNKFETLKGIPLTQIKTLMVGQTVYTNPKDITNQIGQFFTLTVVTVIGTQTFLNLKKLKN